MDDGDIDPLQKKRLCRRRLERGLLTEWYGPVYAARESAYWGETVRPAADYLPEVTKSIFSPETLLKVRLDAEWSAIVGEQFSAMSRVGGLENGVLTLEVRHSAYRKELENAFDYLRTLVNRHLGEERVREIRLAAANRRSRKFGEKSTTSK